MSLVLLTTTDLYGSFQQNLIKNGDFSQGSKYWNQKTSDLEIRGNRLYFHNAGRFTDQGCITQTSNQKIKQGSRVAARFSAGLGDSTLELDKSWVVTGSMWLVADNKRTKIAHSSAVLSDQNDAAETISMTGMTTQTGKIEINICRSFWDYDPVFFAIDDITLEVREFQQVENILYD